MTARFLSKFSVAVALEIRNYNILFQTKNTKWTYYWSESEKEVTLQGKDLAH